MALNGDSNLLRKFQTFLKTNKSLKTEKKFMNNCFL